MAKKGDSQMAIDTKASCNETAIVRVSGSGGVYDINLKGWNPRSDGTSCINKVAAFPAKFQCHYRDAVFCHHMSGFVWVFIGENLLDLLKAGEGNVDILKKVFDEFRGVYAALNSRCVFR